MQSEVISFRPGPELMPLIMADCHKRGVNATEYMIQLIYGAFETQKLLGLLKESLEGMRVHLANGEDPEELMQVLEDLIQIID